MSLESYLSQYDADYISVLTFVNRLYKEASPKAYLKVLINYLFNEHESSIDHLKLYEKTELSYPCPYHLLHIWRIETSKTILQSINKCLDDDDIAINFRDECLKPYKNYYFHINEASKLYEYLKPDLCDLTADPLPLGKNRIMSLPNESIAVKEPPKEAKFPNSYQSMTVLYDYFTPHQAACFIAGLHPSFDGLDDDLEMAEEVIKGGIKNGQLLLDDDQQIKADNLKRFLYEKNWLMKGFNDDGSYGNQNLAEMKEKLIEANVEILKLTAKIDELELDNIILNSSGTIEQIERLTAENKRLKEQLNNQIDLQTDDNKLQSILDDSHEYHAPDLKHAINLWADLYINDKIKGDSHSNKANTWIKHNTNYGGKAETSKTRIREIATPLKDFGVKRSRENEN